MNERDLDAVAALEASSQVFPWSRGNFADSLESGYSVWVLRVGGELIGFSHRHVGDRRGAPAQYRRQQALPGAGLRRPPVPPCHGMRPAGRRGQLFLEARPSNERSGVELYRHFGFRQIGLRKGYYPAVTGREDALIFDKELVAWA